MDWRVAGMAMRVGWIGRPRRGCPFILIARRNPKSARPSIVGWAPLPATGATPVHCWSESYDHEVRSEAEMERIRRYIELNPVKARLVAEPGQYRWSSACQPVAATLHQDD